VVGPNSLFSPFEVEILRSSSRKITRPPRPPAADLIPVERYGNALDLFAATGQTGTGRSPKLRDMIGRGSIRLSEFSFWLLASGF
jgi:hypothetical protein